MFKVAAHARDYSRGAPVWLPRVGPARGRLPRYVRERLTRRLDGPAVRRCRGGSSLGGSTM
jgi:hypothetical protein